MTTINRLNIYQAAIGIHATPVIMANSVNALAQGIDDIDPFAAGIGSLQTIDTFLGLASKSLFNHAAIGLTVASLSNNVFNAKRDLNNYNKITDATYFALASDMAGIMGWYATAALASASAPVVLAVAAAGIAASAALGVYALKAKDGSTGINDLLNSVYQSAIDLGNSLPYPSEIAAQAAYEANAMLESAQAEIGEASSEIYDTLSDYVADSIDEASQELSDAQDSAKDELDKAEEKAQDFLDKASDKAEAAFDEAGQAFDQQMQNAQEAFDSAKAEANDWYDQGSEAFQDALDNAQAEFDNASQSASDTFSEAQDFFNQTMDKVQSEFEQTMNDAQNAFNEALDFANEVYNEVVDQLKNHFDEAKSKVKDWLDTGKDVTDDCIDELCDFLGIGPDVPVPAPPIPPAPRRDPLTLDLNGDGIVGTLDIDQGVFFDLDNSGFAEQTSWVAPDDGLLVLDRNHNGVIDGGAELFGTDTKLADGQYAANGFKALADFDDNNDGHITAQDRVFDELRIWQDRNSNGVTNEGELISLKDLNIASIDLQYQTSTSVDENNVEHREQGVFAYGDQTTGITNTLWFDSDRRQSVPVEVHTGEGIEVAKDIAVLPDVVGFGNVYSLHQAMSLDKTGELQSLVEAFVVETDVDTRWTLVKDILAHWTGQQDTLPDSRGEEVDGQELAILEAFWGQTATEDKPIGQYAQTVMDVYQGLTQSVYSQLMKQSHAKRLFNKLSFHQVEGEWVGDFRKVSEYFAKFFSEGAPSAQVQLQDFIDVASGINPYDKTLQDAFVAELINQAVLLDPEARLAMFASLPQEYVAWGNDGSDYLSDDAGERVLYGQAGDDTLTNRDGDGFLYGGDGDDKLTGRYKANNWLDGGLGDDTLRIDSRSTVSKETSNHLRGGLGNDTISSGYSRDTYYYDLGDGHDVITDFGYDSSEDASNYRPDTLVLGAGIRRDMVSFTHDTEGNLIINIIDPSDGANNGSIILNGAYSNPKNRIESIEFTSDISGASNMDEAAILAASMTMYGTDTDDTIKGSLAADIIYGGAGNDILTNLGNESSLYGGLDNDTLTTWGDDNALFGGVGSDALTATGANNTLDGGAGDDTLTIQSVSTLSNHLRGGLGNDTIMSTNSCDTYYYDLGDGHDIVTDIDYVPAEGDTLYRDKLVFGSNIHRDMVSFTHDSSGNIIIHILDPNNAANKGSITLKGAYTDSNKRIESIEFTSDASGASNMDEAAIMAASLSSGDDRDIYYYQLGGGHDVITDIDNTSDTGGSKEPHNKLVFGAGIHRDMVSFTHDSEGSIVINIVDPSNEANTGSITLRGAWFYAHKRIQLIEFTSDTSGESNMDEAAIVAASKDMHGSDDSDVIKGSWFAETIYGYAGDDRIESGTGDVVYGGQGKDTLTSSGSDNLLYGGDDNDVLTASYGENITLDGGEGDDSLYINVMMSSNNGSNHLRGGLGNDTIKSDYSRDAYYYDLGDGHDVITDTGYDPMLGAMYDYQDKLVFGAQIRREMVSLTNDGNGNIVITITDPNNAANNGSITLNGAYTDAKKRIESIEFTSDASGASNMDQEAILSASAIASNHVDQLVAAMAGFDGAEDIGSVAPQAAINELQPVVVASGQTVL